MTVASIIASRIVRDWKDRYATLSLNEDLGRTCAISQPMYCLRTDLSGFFDSTDGQYDTNILVNSDG